MYSECKVCGRYTDDGAVATISGKKIKLCVDCCEEDIEKIADIIVKKQKNEEDIKIKGNSEIEKIRESIGMNRKKFAEFLHIPYGSITKWETGERKCPDYLIELIDFRIKHM